MNCRIAVLLSAVCLVASSVFAAPLNLDMSARAGLNLIKNVDGDLDADLNFLAPVIFADAYAFPFKGSGTVDWLGLGAGFGLMYSYTDDPDFAWVWSYGDDAIGHNLMVPLYGSIKIKVGGNDKFTPFGKLNLGYCIWFTSDKIDTPSPDRAEGREVGSVESSGGFYWSIGGGADLTNRITAELNLAMFSGNLKTVYGHNGNSEFRAIVDYSFVNIAVGYSF
ncbi:MAG: outer membrane beta-barrel protein [Fibrobacter sp.]|uniref:hypothetical protein n=1 Tax=Fibrobacter sp. TaxID=35828 RepID=UPI0038911994|nr:outer membrane beta-barrel protein [Fibrobacter sp.]